MKIIFFFVIRCYIETILYLVIAKNYINVINLKVMQNLFYFEACILINIVFKFCLLHAIFIIWF